MMADQFSHSKHCNFNFNFSGMYKVKSTLKKIEIFLLNRIILYKLNKGIFILFYVQYFMIF